LLLSSFTYQLQIRETSLHIQYFKQMLQPTLGLILDKEVEQLFWMMCSAPGPRTT